MPVILSLLCLSLVLDMADLIMKIGALTEQLYAPGTWTGARLRKTDQTPLLILHVVLCVWNFILQIQHGLLVEISMVC